MPFDAISNSNSCSRKIGVWNIATKTPCFDSFISFMLTLVYFRSSHNYILLNRDYTVKLSANGKPEKCLKYSCSLYELRTVI